MDPANKVKGTGMIKKLHNMQWLRNNSLSGHKDKAQDEPSKNIDLENSTCSSENMASTSETTDKDSVIEEQAENVWAKNTNAAEALFPNVQSLALQRLDEAEMLSLALTESIMTAQLEAIKLKEAEKKAAELEKETYLLVHSDSEEESIWDKPDRRNVPDDYPETIKADAVKKQHKGTNEKTENLTKHIEVSEPQVKNTVSCTVTENSEKKDYKEDENTCPASVASIISDESQKSENQKESSAIQSRVSPKEDKEIESGGHEKQLIKNNNDVAKHDKKPLTTRQKPTNTAQKSISHSKPYFNRPTERSNNFVKKDDSKIRPNNNSFSTIHKNPPTEYKYSAYTRKREIPQNRQHEAEDTPSKGSGSFYIRNDATKDINRRQTNSYKKYDTRYVLKQAGSSNEGTNSEPRKEFSVSRTEAILARNAQSAPNRNTKQAVILNTESDSSPQKSIPLNDKLNYEHDLPKADNQQNDDINNNKPEKNIESVRENNPLPKNSSLQVQSNKYTEQTENLARRRDRPSSAMKRTDENNTRDNENNHSKAKNNSQTSTTTPRPILARHIGNNDTNVPPEMLRCQNVHDNIQRSVLQFSDVTRDIFNANQRIMPPPELSYDMHGNNRNAILPSAAVCPEMYTSNHPAISPPPGFYNQQTFPLSNQWNAHTASLQPQNSGPMCGNYLLPQQFSCASPPDLCFAGSEAHQQAHAFTVPCGQAVHVINPMYGSYYTIPANMYEDAYRNSQSGAANNPSFPTNGNTRSEMRSQESQDIRIGIDVRMNRCQNVYVPEQKQQQQNFYGAHNYGNLLSNMQYDDGSRRSDQLNQASNAIMRLNYKCSDGAVDFTARVSADDKASEVPIVNPREHLDSGFPSRRIGMGRGRLRPRDV